jgi:beta-phosphoglucomutase
LALRRVLRIIYRSCREEKAMPMRNLGVIFDMDGVLVDSFDPHFDSWLALARETGTGFTREQFAATFGRTSREILAELWPHPLTEAQIKQYDDRKEALYREIIRTNFPEMPGARKLIADLKDAGFRLAVGSSGPLANIDAALEGLGHRERFDAVVSAHDVAIGKPHPEVFLKAAEKLGLTPADCVVVEDAPAGIEAANRAGIACIAITGTAPRERLAGARIIIESLSELSPQRIAELIRP